MQFELLPCIEKMIEFYGQPKSAARFKTYLNMMLDQNGEDVVLPIMIFNPMAKAHVVDKLKELSQLKAEDLTITSLQGINNTLQQIDSIQDKGIFKVCLVVADDAKGGWTNRFTTDYQCRFTIKGLLNRNFCTPIFWSSESYTNELIENRIKGFVWRTVFQLLHQQPENLAEHVQQEAFVHENCYSTSKDFKEIDSILNLFDQHRHSSDRNVLISFLYGDDAANELGYTPLGLPSFAGIKAAGQIVNKFY